MKRRMNKELNNLLFIIFKIWLAEKLQIEVFQSIVEVNLGRKKKKELKDADQEIFYIPII